MICKLFCRGFPWPKTWELCWLDPGMRRHSWCVAHLAWVEVLGVGVPAVGSGIVAVNSGGMILLRSWA